MAGFHTTQGTLAAKATFSGRGLHSGKRVTITVHPAAPGHGIVFAKDLWSVRKLAPHNHLATLYNVAGR